MIREPKMLSNALNLPFSRAKQNKIYLQLGLFSHISGELWFCLHFGTPMWSIFITSQPSGYCTYAKIYCHNSASDGDFPHMTIVLGLSTEVHSMLTHTSRFFFSSTCSGPTCALDGFGLPAACRHRSPEEIFNANSRKHFILV